MLTDVVDCCLLFDELVLHLFAVQGSLLLPRLVFVEKNVIFILFEGDQSHFTLNDVFRLMPFVLLEGVAMLGKHFTIECECFTAVDKSLFHENAIWAGRNGTAEIHV